MTAPAHRPAAGKAAQLAAQAREAAEVRDALTHPDVVALRVERVRAVADRFIWLGMALGLLFTAVNVQVFAAAGAEPGTLRWLGAWFLDPAVTVILLGVLIAEGVTSRWQVPMGPWTRFAKWSLLGATYVMNTWESWASGSAAGVVLHSVPPLAVFVAAECRTDIQDKLTECVHRAHEHAAQRAERKAAAERAQREAPAPAAAVPPEPVVTAAVPAGVSPLSAAVLSPVLRAVPDDHPQPAPVARLADRPGARTADRPGARTADRPAVRSGPGPVVRPAERPAQRPVVRSGVRSSGRPAGRSGRSRPQRTDEQLAAEVREMTAANGRPPSQYQLKQQFGIGSTRAARLLAELAATPANGAAEQTGGAQ